MISAAIDGEYFTATNPTWGTGLTLSSGARTTFSATEAAIAIVTATKQVIPHFIRLTCVGAGTGMTSVQFGLIADAGNRYSAGGTLLTPYNANLGSATAATSTQRAGNLTMTAATAPRQLARVTAKTAAAPTWAAGDSITLWFGSPGSGAVGSTSGTTATDLEFVVPPVVVYNGGSLCTLLLHYWAPAQATSPTVEVSMGWWERTP